MTGPAVQPAQAQTSKHIMSTKKTKGYETLTADGGNGSSRLNNLWGAVSEYSSPNNSGSASMYDFAGAAPKTSILRERTIRISEALQNRRGSLPDIILDNINSFDDFLDALAAERLRFMPHSGTKWDKVLRWAEGFTTYMYAFHHAVHAFILYSDDASKMIWSSVLSLLQMGPQHINVLMRVFSIFHRLGLSVSLFVRQEALLTATAEIRREIAHAYSDLVELSCAVSEHYVSKSNADKRIEFDDFSERFDGLISSFHRHRDEVANSMWMTHIEGHFGDTTDFQDIRDFLEPADLMVRTILSNRSSFAPERAEFTCEWFSSHLNNFVMRNNKMLLVTGGVGCGKTVLSDWIVETLHGSLDHHPHDVIFYQVWRDIPETTTPLNLVKTLLHQALNRNIGYESVIASVRSAMTMSASGKTASEVEDVLWNALEDLASLSKMIIVVDGLDQLTGDHHVTLQHLQSVTGVEKNSQCKSIVLSRPLQKPAPAMTQHFSISEESVHQDIKRFVQTSLDEYEHTVNMSARDKKEIAQKTAEKSRGSFLWAELAFECLKDENSRTGFMQWLDKAPKSAEGLLDHHIRELSLGNEETMSILSCVIAAERPLSATELRHLLEIDTKTAAHVAHYNNIADVVRHATGSVVDIINGFVSLKHPSMRQHIMAYHDDKFKFDLHTAHSSITLKLLAYVKVHVNENMDVNWGYPRMYDVQNYFERYELLGYCARYWMTHLRSSRMYTGNGPVVDATLKQCWPKSTLLAVLEGSCFYWGRVIEQVQLDQRIAYDIRKIILGADHPATLQSLLSVIQSYRHTKPADLTTISFEAWTTSKAIADSTVVLACAEVFISTTESLNTMDTRIVTWRLQILQDLIATYKQTLGVSHELTVKYTKALAEYYVATNQIDSAVGLCHELYDINIERYGYFNEETTAVYDVLVSQLRKLEKQEIILQILKTYHDYVCKHLSVDDERRVKSTMHLVRMYEETNEVAKAEEVLVSYWGSIMNSTPTSTSVASKIDVAVEYSRFLRRHQRNQEAEAVMRGVHSELENHDDLSRSDAIEKRMKTIAEEFKSLNVYSMARSILSSLWNRSTKTVDSSPFHEEIATSLAETVTQEMAAKTDMITTTASRFSTMANGDESTLRDVFESSLTLSPTSATSSITKTGVALASSYYKQEKYEEAADTYMKVLSRTWPTVESTKTSHLDQTEEMVQVAMNLAECHFKLLHIERCEDIYHNIFQVLLRGNYDHNWLVRSVKEIIQFHEKIYRFDAVLMYYRGFCQHLQNKVGKGHGSTIETFLAYGAIARKLGKKKEAIEAFLSIHLAYKLDDGCLKQNGIEPSFVLCELYEKNNRWEDACSVYACLWLTFIKHEKVYKMGHATVERVYESYMFILSNKVETKFEVIRKVSLEYRDMCMAIYGRQHELTIRAIMHLAEICERNDDHQDEAAALYEEVLKNSESSNTRMLEPSDRHTSITLPTSTTSVSSSVRNKLANIYSSKPDSATRAISLREEQFDLLRKEHGYSAPESLSVMRELVASCRKQNSKESHQNAISTLRNSAMGIFKSAPPSHRTIEAARTIAKTYMESEYKQDAMALIQELRTTIIQEVRKTSKTNLSPYVFYAAFTEAVNGTSFSSVMAEIRSEILLYESYFQAIHSSVNLTTILERGSRLRTFLLDSKEPDEAKKIEEEMFSRFVKQLTVPKSVDQSVQRDLLNICLDNMAEDDSQTLIIERSVQTVYEHTNNARFAPAYDLSLLIHSYIHLQGGYTTARIVHAVSRLCIYLMGRGTKSAKETNADQYNAMRTLSAAMLHEALEASIALNMSFTDMPVTEINEIIIVLGEQQNYEDLERILTSLWSSRLVQSTWSSSTVVALGRRLIETRFSRGRHDEAIHLCADIRYNLSRVWGQLDPQTEEFTVLESELLSSQQRYADAMALHEDTLRHLANDDEEELRSAEVTNPVVSAVTHIGYMQHAYGRLRGWGAGRDPRAVGELIAEVGKRFGNEKEWQEKRPQPVDKWKASADAKDSFGLWKQPETFDLMEKGVEASWAERRRGSALRRVSIGVAMQQQRAAGGAGYQGWQISGVPVRAM